MAGLGRGFGSLIPTDFVDENFDTTAAEDSKESQLVELEIDKIIRDEGQPREEFDEEALNALSSSIKEHGVLMPIIVVKEGTKYKIVAGERRWRASKLAGLKKIPAIIRTLDAQKRLELSIIENAQREDLNAIELATAYAKLKSQFNMDAKKIAERVGKSETAIVNTMRLLNLPTEVKQIMLEHKLSEGVMRPLVGADKNLIDQVLPKIINDGWSSRKVEHFVSERKQKTSKKAIKTSVYNKQEDALAEKYHATVRVRGRSITFTAKTDAELKKLLERL